MALTRYGWQEPQTVAAAYLKPDTEDKNVTPQEMVGFVNEMTGVRAVTRIGGDMEIIKQLIAQEFPVLIETAYYPEGSDFLGHYHTVVGYDDTQGVFYVYDSYLGTGQGGAGLAVPYNRFDQDWAAFNRVFIVIYEQNLESVVTQVLGELATVEGAARRALAIADQEALTNPRNPFAWFNRGTSLVRLGEYEEAARAYDRARALGTPFRMLWYQFGPFEAYFNVGRYDDVEALVNSNLTTGAEYVEETYYWQGQVMLARGNEPGAASAFQRALTHNERYQEARDALSRLNS
jgi:tetratricopeptide (TPR) repeat protein